MISNEIVVSFALLHANVMRHIDLLEERYPAATSVVAPVLRNQGHFMALHVLPPILGLGSTELLIMAEEQASQGITEIRYAHQRALANAEPIFQGLLLASRDDLVKHRLFLSYWLLCKTPASR